MERGRETKNYSGNKLSFLQKKDQNVNVWENGEEKNVQEKFNVAEWLNYQNQGQSERLGWGSKQK